MVVNTSTTVHMLNNPVEKTSLFLDDEEWCFTCWRMDKKSREKLADLIRSVRGERSQRQFARELGVSYAAIQAWEHQDGFPTLESFEIIAEEARMSVPELWEFVKGEKSHQSQIMNDTAESLMARAKFLSRKEQLRLMTFLAQNLAQTEPEELS